MSYFGWGAAFGGESDEAGEVLDEDDAAGDWDKSITVADGSSESEDRLTLALGGGEEKDLAFEERKDTDKELSLSAFLSAIRLLILSFNGSW